MDHQQSPVPLDERLTLRIAEVVKISGLSRSTIYNLIKSGRLPTMKVGTCRLVRRDDLVDLLGKAP